LNSDSPQIKHFEEVFLLGIYLEVLKSFCLLYWVYDLALDTDFKRAASEL